MLPMKGFCQDFSPKMRGGPLLWGCCRKRVEVNGERAKQEHYHERRQSQHLRIRKLGPGNERCLMLAISLSWSPVAVLVLGDAVEFYLSISL